jgi:hypothetical protein
MPSPRLQGYKVVAGLLANSFSDTKNYVPRVDVDPPSKNFFRPTDTKKQASLAEKASEAALFLRRITSDDDKAREYFENVLIDGIPAVQICDEFKYSQPRELGFALALLNDQDFIRTPKPMEPVWLIAQSKGFPTWEGPFKFYMNVGTKDKPRGLMVEGEDKFVTDLYIFDSPSKYPDFKKILLKISVIMKWRDSIRYHLKYVIQDPEQSRFFLNTVYFKDSFQARISLDFPTGLPIRVLNYSGLDQPKIIYGETTTSGVQVHVEYLDEIWPARTLNYRLNHFFNLECDDPIGIFPTMTECWNQTWFFISQNFKIPIDDMVIYNDPSKIYLPKVMVNKINEFGYNLQSLNDLSLTIKDITSGKKRLQDNLNHTIFYVRIPWSSASYRSLLSASIIVSSTLTCYISYRMQLEGKTSQYAWLPARETLLSLQRSSLRRFSIFEQTLIQLKEFIMMNTEVVDDSEVLVGVNEWKDVKIIKINKSELE